MVRFEIRANLLKRQIYDTRIAGDQSSARMRPAEKMQLQNSNAPEFGFSSNLRRIFGRRGTARPPSFRMLKAFAGTSGSLF